MNEHYEETPLERRSRRRLDNLKNKGPLHKESIQIFTFFSSIIFAAIVLLSTLFLTACNKSYLPWSRETERANPLDDTTINDPVTPATPRSDVSSVNDAPAPETDNWCEENRADVARWRQYLEPDFDWNTIPENRRERTRRAVEQIVSHWDSRCN